MPILYIFLSYLVKWNNNNNNNADDLDMFLDQPGYIFIFKKQLSH